VTGTFYDAPHPGSLAQAVRRFDPLAIDPAACVRNAKRFDLERFRRGIRALVAEARDGGRVPREERRRAPRGLAVAS
jgi:hypothetical protein